MLANARNVNKLRSYLRGLASRRSSGTVTADDVHRWINNNTNIGEDSSRIRLSYVNAALREPDFTPGDWTVSERPAAKGRMISEWSY